MIDRVREWEPTVPMATNASGTPPKKLGETTSSEKSSSSNTVHPTEEAVEVTTGKETNFIMYVQEYGRVFFSYVTYQGSRDPVPLIIFS